uniref:Uncharacterized protein n=1 Tax=Anguilla anguilla TaxID=7936 RepID=A0A0E9W5Z6_ANGAN
MSPYGPTSHSWLCHGPNSIQDYESHPCTTVWCHDRMSPPSSPQHLVVLMYLFS